MNTNNALNKEDNNNLNKEGELLVPQERRDYPRVAINVQVRYRVLDDTEEDKNLIKNFDPDKIFHEYNESKVVNISTSGLLMHTKEEIPVKKFVVVCMYLPLPGLSCNIKTLAEVIRSEPAPEDVKKQGYQYNVALKFLKVIHHSLNKFKFLSLIELLDVKGDNIKLS
jgi:hypothetical protein